MREIDYAKSNEAQRVAKRVADIMARSGFAIELSIGDEVPVPKKKFGKPKYWNPNTGQTWSGRGREPKWIIGKDRAEFLLPDDEDR